MSFPSNVGGTGLFDIPNARIMEDWNFRFGYSDADPYGTFFVSTTFLPRVEFNGRMTRISGVPSGLANFGTSKDRSADFKIQLFKESDSWPAITVGANDFHGTSLFASRYLVASKFIGPFDITVGLGQGILAGETVDASDSSFPILTSKTSKTRVFGGLEFRITEDLSFVGEYSSLDFSNMYGVEEKEESPFNFGLKYRWGSNLFSASYQRGDLFAWSYAAQFPLKPEGLLPWKKQPFWTPEGALKKKSYAASNEELAVIIRRVVAGKGFSNVRTSTSDAAVWLEIENPTYLSNTKALGRALRIVSGLAPPRIEWLYISLKSKDIILVTVKLGRKDFEAYIDKRLDTETLLDFITMDDEGNESRSVFLENEPGASPLSEPIGQKKLQYGVLPSWRTYLYGEEEFVRNTFSFLWYASYYPWAGGYLTSTIQTPVYNELYYAEDTEESDPVRTDSIKYLSQTDLRVETLAYDQVFNMPKKWLGRFGAGYFESAYAGLAFEFFRFFNDGRFGVGIESELVKKRDIDNEFELLKGSPLFETGFLNLYYKLLPSLGLDVGLKLGRFLAGDWGGRLDVSRTYKHFTLGAWYTITDTSIFEASFNDGYRDKGIYIRVPFSVFTDHDSPLKLLYGFRPWGRDSGQTVHQVNSLYPMANGVVNIDGLKRQLEDLNR